MSDKLTLKRNGFLSILCSIILIFGLYSLAIGSGWDIGVPVDDNDSQAVGSTSLTVAGEVLGGASYDVPLDGVTATPLGNVIAPVTLYYKTDVILNPNDYHTIVLSGAQFATGGIYYFLYDERTPGNIDINGDGDQTDIVNVGSSVSAANPGDTQITIRNNTYVIPANSTLILTQGLSQVGDNVGAAYNGADNIVLRFAPGTSCGTRVTIRTSQVLANGTTPVPAAETGTQTIADVECQISMGWVQANSVIDVNAANPRTLFVDETVGVGSPPYANGDTDTTSSVGLLTISNDPDGSIEDFIALANAIDNLILTYQAANNSFKGVSYIWWDVENSNNNREISEQFAPVDGSADSVLTLNDWGAGLPAHGAYSTDDLVIDVNGTTPLDPTNWALNWQLQINQSHPVAGGSWVNPSGSFTTHIWTITGMQAKIPYLALNAPGYLSFIKVANEDSNPVDIIFDVIIWNLTDDITTTQSNVKVKTVAGNSIETITESDIMNALGLDSSKMYHLEITVTAIGPRNSVHISAFQKDPQGRTDVPVLYNIYPDPTNGTDQRIWQ